MTAQTKSDSTKHFIGKLTVKVIQAQLLSNRYGNGIRISPYVRMRIAGRQFQTPIAFESGKNPIWEHTITCEIPPTLHTIDLVIMNAKSNLSFQRLASGQIRIPAKVIFRGETVNDWFVLKRQEWQNYPGQISLTFGFVLNPNYIPYCCKLRTRPIGLRPLPQTTEEHIQHLHQVFFMIDIETVRAAFKVMGDNVPKVRCKLRELIELLLHDPVNYKPVNRVSDISEKDYFANW